MPNTLRADAALTRLNNVQPSMAKALIDVNRVESSDVERTDAEVLSLIARAIKRAGLKQEALAALAGVKPSQFSAALNGHGNFSVRWMDGWPVQFWDAFIELLRAEKEGSQEAKRLQRKERLIQAIELLIVECA